MNPVSQWSLMEERCCVPQRSSPDCELITVTPSNSVSVSSLRVDNDQSRFMVDINYPLKTVSIKQEADDLVSWSALCSVRLVDRGGL